MIKIKPITAQKGLRAFIDFPHDLYKDEPNYVPELFVAQRELLTKHPFLKHSSVQYFLAYRGDEVVGRIAAILNNRHNQYNEATDGFFGFFDCINDQVVANLLFNAASEWLKEREVTKIIGPANFSFNETAGLLIEGFEFPPVVMMPYNASYYQDLIENIGFVKSLDLLAFRFGEHGYDDKSLRLLDSLQDRLKRSRIILRKINMKNFKTEAVSIREVYNKAWDKNTGFVPMTDHEFDHIGKEMKMILDPDFCQLAEQDGKIVGFALAVPDFNQVLKKVKRGRLLPIGLLNILLNRRKVSGIRIILLGVIDGYRKMGIEACLYGTIIKEYRRKKLKYAEASWTLEDNHLINNAITAIKGVPYKKYRVYKRNI
jgi:GNAT superfamily N-acetyltransferase